MLVQITTCSERSFYHYRFDGDTTINNTSYKQLIKPFLYHVSWGDQAPCWIYPFGYTTGYMGALREDSVANKVFFLSAGTSNERVLFDYNLIVGDTIQRSCTIVVESIDSVLIENSYRKRWNFQTCHEGSGYVIEGIGSDNGLIEPLDGMWTVGALICVKSDTVVVFNTNRPSDIGCQLVTSVENHSFNTHKCNIFPNPATNQFTLQFNQPLQSQTSIELTDVQGRAIFQSSISDQTSTLPLAVATGIYFLTVKEKGEKVFVEKLMVE